MVRMGSVGVWLLCGLFGACYLQGCGGGAAGEEDGSGSISVDLDATAAPAEEVEVTADMAANLVACEGTQLGRVPMGGNGNKGNGKAEGPTFPMFGKYNDYNPKCLYPIKNFFYDNPTALAWAQFFGVLEKHGDVVVLKNAGSALGCAKLCKEEPECFAWEYMDEVKMNPDFRAQVDQMLGMMVMGGFADPILPSLLPADCEASFFSYSCTMYKEPVVVPDTDSDSDDTDYSTWNHDDVDYATEINAWRAACDVNTEIPPMAPALLNDICSGPLVHEHCGDDYPYKEDMVMKDTFTCPDSDACGDQKGQEVTNYYANPPTSAHMKVSGYKPNADWTSAITECPFGQKVVITAEAQSSAMNLVATTILPDTR
jgi:hypothetical protein